MNLINFFTPTIAPQRDATLWFRLSLTLIIGALAVMIGLQIKTMKTWHTVQQEQSAALCKKQQLQELQSTIQQKTTEISLSQKRLVSAEQIKTTNSTLLQNLKTVVAYAEQHHITINVLNLTSGSIQLTFTAPKTNVVNLFVDALRTALALPSLSIIQLKTTNQGIIATAQS